MECDRIQDLLSGYVDGELPPDAAGGIDAHLAECPGCAAAAQGLRETLTLLAALPRESAPPELLEGVLRKIEGEKAGAGSPWRKLFRPARVKIPIEAAAAVLLFLIAYGVQKQMPAERTSPPPAARAASPRAEPAGGAGPARSEAPPPRAAAPVPKTTREAASLPPAVAPRPSAPPSAAEDAAGKPSPLPAVPATLVSSEARALPSATRRDAPGGPHAPGVLAAPPSRLLRPLPYGREVTIVVSSGDRPGIEERIAAAALRRGGTVVGEPRAAGERAETDGGEMKAPEPVRVHVPAGSADAFVEDLRALGAVPAEGMPSRVDLPAGPSPGVVAYTVRIRVR